MEKKLISKKVSDIEYAVYLIYHIRNPCIEPTTGLNIRDFYIREAQRAISILENPYAIELLKTEIKRYSL